MIGYNVHTPADREAMLAAIGVASIDDLFAQIPAEVRLTRELSLPGPMSEWELARHMRALAARNATTLTHLSFLGGGAYEHYIPAVVPAIASRGEYLTAYTPYQPEMSQGLLRVLHDFQIVMSRLLGLPAVNCSVYDGATALAESAWMASQITGIRHVLVSELVWRDWRTVLETYMAGRGVALTAVPSDPATGEIDLAALEALLAKQPAAAVLVQTPNQAGVIEPLRRVAERAHAHGALLVASWHPLLSGVFATPGELGADIVCGEAQPLGLPLNAGGPYLGVMATRAEHEKHLPGRIVGECSDLKGEPALALVKEEREQHVSRYNATSHICSNQALLAVRALVYLCTVGERGLHEIARLNVQKAHWLCDRLCALPGVTRAVSGRFFNEFLLRLPCPASALLRELEAEGIFGGLDYSRFDEGGGDRLLVAVTEVRSRADLERAVAAFAGALERVGGERRP
jgi:glycine dehydrogenase subunit 1